jgi:hypothetical protein
MRHLHQRCCGGRETVTQKEFEDFWKWYGKCVQVLRYQRHIGPMWESGYVCSRCLWCAVGGGVVVVVGCRRCCWLDSCRCCWMVVIVVVAMENVVVCTLELSRTLELSSYWLILVCAAVRKADSLCCGVLILVAAAATAEGSSMAL